uniref:Osteoclast-stimulating factor 1 n=1 Tax=Myripristis murdjan TaxID=586833 RepID=A0A667Z0L0_9TELE
MDFEGTMGDEMTVRTGDVVKNVTKSNEEGWLEGELRGKKGIFPANFVKEVPVYLIGDSKREPRSIRKTKRMKQQRKCEVTYAYSPMNEDELELAVGEIIEIIREIEDGWWMGLKNGKVGAFPSNFVKEIFVLSKVRPKLADAVFSKEVLTECCQVMFDYKAQTDDELALKKGDIVMIISKETEDEGWWEGELNGRRGFFPDNFVMVIPPVDNLQVSGHETRSQEYPRRRSGKTTVSIALFKHINEKPEGKDLRSNPPTKVKLPCINKPSPPPVKDKPNKANGEFLPVSPKQPEEKDSDQFDGVDVSTEKLSHPTANRAKPPQRRPPSGLVTAAQFDQKHITTAKKAITGNVFLISLEFLALLCLVARGPHVDMLMLRKIFPAWLGIWLQTFLSNVKH